MIIAKGELFDASKLNEAEAVLLYEAGIYFYVDSDIVDNELRVMRNFEKDVSFAIV